MAITFITSSNNSALDNGVSSLNCAFGAAVSIGDLLVAHIGWNDAGSYSEITGVTSNSGTLTWTRATGNACIAGNGLTECIYYAVAIASGTPTVAVTWSANQPYIDIRVQAFSGFTGTPTLDEVAGATGNSGTASTGASGTTDVDAELVVAGGMTDNGFIPNDLSINTVLCTGHWVTNPNYDTWGYKIQSATGTQTGTATLNSSGGWVITLATFKDVAGETGVITGTITNSTTEANIVAGGKTIIITLTGDTWKPDS